MLILWIILAILGAVLVFFGRRMPERVMVWAGYLVFIAAIVVFIIWLIAVLDNEGVDLDTAMLLLR